MKNIAWIAEQIKTVSGFVAEDKARALVAPLDFGARLIAKNKAQHLESLQHDLMLAQAERNKEVVELRLIAPQMDRGAIPLRFLARISEPLHKLLASAAYHIRHGRDFGKGLPDEWTNMLDLRLAGVGYGSTRLFITGNVTPDLAGDSALQDGLGEIFSLLNADQESIYDAIHRIGPSAARGLVDFLAEMEREKTAAEFCWTTPNDQQLRWEGRHDEISRLRYLIESAETDIERKLEDITGTVSLLSDSGRIELIPDGSPSKIKISFPKGEHAWVHGVALRDRVQVRVEKSSLFDRVADKERALYALIAPIVRHSVK